MIRRMLIGAAVGFVAGALLLLLLTAYCAPVIWPLCGPAPEAWYIVPPAFGVFGFFAGRL